MTSQEAREITEQHKIDRWNTVSDFLYSKIKEQANAGYSVVYLELPTAFFNEIDLSLKENGYQVNSSENSKNPMFTNFYISW